MYGIAGLLLLGAVVVQLIAPERANVEMPTRRNGRGHIDVGLWALYLPFALALLAAWHATARLPHTRLGRRRVRWILLLAMGPAVLFAIVAFDALA